MASAIATDSGETNRLDSVSRVSAVACLSSLIAKRLSAWISCCSCGVSARGSAVMRGGDQWILQAGSGKQQQAIAADATAS